MLSRQSFQIADLHAAYADGLKPQALIDEAFRRLEAVQDPGIFLHLMDGDAIQSQIASLGEFDLSTKPLWGIPFAAKDNIDAAGAPTTAACPDYTYHPSENAFAVEALMQAGAILIGKTNLDQFATGLVGVRTPYPVPKNALDPDIVPGGSSSGSSVSVAHGIVSFSLGTDTAGSGRVPAALNNIVGLKPTLGAISNSGVVPACRTLDTISIFALSVEDANRVFQSAAAFDPSDAYAKPISALLISAPPTSFRIGVPDKATIEFFGDDVQSASFADTLESIKAMGGEIVELDFTPLYNVAKMLYEGAWVAERYAAIEDFLSARPESVHPVTRQIIETTNKYSPADVFRGFYRLQDLKRAAEPLLSSVDVLCVPTIPTFYSVADLEADPIGPNARLGTYTNFVNLLDMCGLAVPTKPRSDGRPGNVTLLAGAGQDAQLAAIGEVIHQVSDVTLGATDWRLSDKTERAPHPGHGEIALAAVGAHMSGLPLNSELTCLGARFLYASKTEPCYRLYSLPGGPPFRPGLVKGDNGAAIALEVWALPTEQFGEFMQGIPHPLGIGTLSLENGEEVKGFICEPSGIVGAQDVTEHGGWHAYTQTLVNAIPHFEMNEF